MVKDTRDHIYIDGSLERETTESHNRRFAVDFDFIRVNVRDARRKFPSAKVLVVTHRERDSISLFVLWWRCT